MNLTATSDPVPLRPTDSGRVLRVGSSRVTLDAVVRAFERGATAEEIVQGYPSLSLADVYAVIAYYLRHVDEVRAYLAERAAEHEELRAEIESRPRYQQLRQRLLARRQDLPRA